MTQQQTLLPGIGAPLPEQFSNPDVERALTLTQPWGGLIVSGVKRIENRPWKPAAHMLGRRFAIHASREIDLGGARVRATRMTYVGELGWEVLVPVADAAGVYDALIAAGADLGVTNAGYYTIESMRLEKGYRAFGRELTPDFGPVEAGLVFATALKGTKDFLGRALQPTGPSSSTIAMPRHSPSVASSRHTSIAIGTWHREHSPRRSRAIRFRHSSGFTTPAGT